MANGKVCPACAKDIGVWAIFSAGGPSRIRCPHCRARLRYDGAMAVMAAPFAVVVFAALVIHEVAVDVGVARPGLFSGQPAARDVGARRAPSGALFEGPSHASDGRPASGPTE